MSELLCVRCPCILALNQRRQCEMGDVHRFCVIKNGERPQFFTALEPIYQASRSWKRKVRPSFNVFVMWPKLPLTRSVPGWAN